MLDQVHNLLNLGRGAAQEIANLLRRDPRTNLCILIDQFEELFSFARQHGRDKAQLFVDFLVGLQETPPPGLYAILTMRSEFLGVCARFKGLAEAVNRTQYLLPQMEQPALVRAIREPPTLYDGEVTRELAERLILDAEGGQDQLPLIQHGLMRLWRRKAGPPSGHSEVAAPYPHDGLSESPTRFEIDEAPLSFRRTHGPAWRLGLEDYQGGDLAMLLSDHADEVMAAAAPDAKREKIVEHLFRALTDINAEGSAVRRPQTLAELVAVTGSDEQTLRDIIDQFRADGVSFVRPYGNDAIEPGTLIDISHEALIRCWRKIKDGWVYREFEDGLIWKSLRLQAQRDETLGAAATKDRDNWLKALPSAEWCERYGGGWADVQKLMKLSRKARDQEARREREFQEARRREAEGRAQRAEEAHRAAEALAGKEQELREAQEQRAEAEQRRAAEAEERAMEADAGRRRSRRLAIAASLFALAALAAAGVAGWSWLQADRALGRAVRAEVEAEVVRNKAYLENSLLRSSQARDQLKEGWPVIAMQLALSGLPDDPEKPKVRPWVGETAGALVEALGVSRERLVLRGPDADVLAAAFSPDGARIVSGAADGTVRVWNAGNGKQLQVLKGDDGLIKAVAYSPDGNRIVSGSEDKTVRVWDPASVDKPSLTLLGHEGWVNATAFSPDGERIVSGSADRTVRVWDATNGEQLQILTGHDGDVLAAAFSPDGAHIVSGSRDDTVRVWDIASGKELRRLDGHQGGVNAVAFSPDGVRIVSGSADDTVRVWDAASQSEPLVLRGHEGDVLAAVFSRDGARIVSGAEDRTVRVWDLVTGLVLVLRGHERWVTAVEFSPDSSQVLSASADNTVRTWDVGTLQDLVVLEGHEGDVLAAAFSPDGARIVSGSADSTARVWSAARGRDLERYGHLGNVLAVAFSPAGGRIISASADGYVRVWDPAGGEQPTLVLPRNESSVNDVAFSPDGGRIVTGFADGVVRVWDATSRQQLLVLEGHEGDVLAAAFSPDGVHIVSGSKDNTVRIWDAASGAELLLLRGHRKAVNAVAFSPDGGRIVSASADGTVRVWDAESGQQLQALNGHDGDVLAAAFSPDGARIVSGAEDRTVRVWDVPSGNEFLVLRGHEGAVFATAFSPDGVRIVSGSDDNTIRITWIGHDRGELIKTARARLPRELTDEEQRRFYLAED